jgi:Skp family chaperone for outer membrane proteins
MKTRAVVLGVLTSAVVLFLGYGYSAYCAEAAAKTGSAAEPGAGAVNSKIGIVSMRNVFRDCKVNASYREEALAEQAKKNAELDVLEKEIAAQEAGVKALRPGTGDYMKQYEDLLNKQARFEAAKQFVSQQRALKDRRWTEDLYKEVLRITKELAKQKGLTVVLEADEPNFPMPSADELMMALQTHKVLYSDGCMDLTAEVVTEMNKIESQFKL